MSAVLIALLAAAAALLLGKVLLMRRTLRELSDGVDAALSGETNALLTVASRDGALREHADRLNAQLRRLRDQRLRFTRGDRELRDAVTAVAHDLRTPLTSIRGYLELLEREPLTQDARRYVALIDERTQALSRLCEDLFRYSVAVTAREMKSEPLDLRAALEESLLAMCADFERRGVEPQVCLPDAPVRRTLDAQALARVFANILGNALGHGDGDLSVKMEQTGEIRFTNGAKGLSAVDVERLFDRFYTVNTGRGSTGLGLYIAKTLTERMGGTAAATVEDGFLTVCVRFPEDGRAEEKDANA